MNLSMELSFPASGVLVFSPEDGAMSLDFASGGQERPWDSHWRRFWRRLGAFALPATTAAAATALPLDFPIGSRGDDSSSLDVLSLEAALRQSTISVAQAEAHALRIGARARARRLEAAEKEAAFWAHIEEENGG